MIKIKILQIIESLLIIFLIVLPLRFFMFEPFIVRGESMEPNFHDLDYLIIDKLTYKIREPKRGEVIIFTPPFDKNKYYIKRIIGLPNEKIEFKENNIYVYNQNHPEGVILEENYLKNIYKFYPDFSVNLKNDEYFVLGDNREESYDSRAWGPIKKEDIVGRVLIVIRPLGKFIKLIHIKQGI